jgi:predicted transcriptional regulator/GNAT superfamily N-acetyltransferase
VRFGGTCGKENERLADLRTLIEECENNYPGIDIWFKKKVEADFRSEKRSGFLIYENDLPIGAAIVRKGSDAKLCSMRIREEEQRKGIGTLLLSLVAGEIRNAAARIHFTAPYEIWSKWESFFKSFGFQHLGFAKIQYRLFDKDVFCTAKYSDVWSAILKKLPKMVENLTLNGNSAHCDLVLSVRPKFAQKIVSGIKRIEIRRRFPNKWEGASVLLYASSPACQFVGEALIERVVTKPVDDIWAECKRDLGCTHDQFMAYCHGAKQVAALVLSQVKRFKKPIKKADIQGLIGRNLSSPQSYSKIDTHSAWPTAVSLGCLMGTGLVE